MGIFCSTEFWSAIAGAIVGGLIVFGVQMIALRETRRQRAADLKNRQMALANALLFKMARIYSNLHSIHRHFEDCFAEGKKRGITGEPCQFVVPIANPPDPVHFSSDEMGMLLAQKDDDVFNTAMEMYTVHNSLIAAVEAFNTHRSELGERIAATLQTDKVGGPLISGVAAGEELRPLRHRMIDVNMLIESRRSRAKRDVAQSGNAMNRLQALLRKSLGLTYRLTSKSHPSDDGNTST